MKYKQTTYSLEHALPDTIVKESILARAGCIKRYEDKDGRMIYVCNKKPVSFRPAFIYFEEYEGE